MPKKAASIEQAYGNAWRFRPPKTCREMHAAGLFASTSPNFLELSVLEVYDADTIDEGDAYVSEQLIEGLVPIGGDGSGDRWCFDARVKIGGTTPVVHCPHDGGAARYVAPSFASFIFRLLAYNFVVPPRRVSANDLPSITERNLSRARRWLLSRWAARLTSLSQQDVPTEAAFEAWLLRDSTFARLPRASFDHFAAT